jgi:hypothetical protein
MVTISRNKKKDGIELKFDSKPGDSVLQWFKDNKFRWSSFAMVWWKKFTPEDWELVHKYFEQPLPGDSDKFIKEHIIMATITNAPATAEHQKYIDEYAQQLAKYEIAYIDETFNWETVGQESGNGMIKGVVTKEKIDELKEKAREKAKISAEKYYNLVVNKESYERLHGFLTNTANKGSRKLFEQVTGINLGKTVGEAQKIVNNYFGEEVVKAEEAKQAEEIKASREAFERGDMRVPAQDFRMSNLLKGFQVGESIPVLDAWLKGWDNANIAANPLPEPEKIKVLPDTYFTKDNAPDNIRDRFSVVKTKDADIIMAVPKDFAFDIEGLKVFFVDGEYIRDNIYSDFSQGGNDMAYPEFVPIGELWIEKLMIAEQNHILKHEKDERELILQGMTYEEAHKVVKDAEDKERGIEAEKDKVIPILGKEGYFGSSRVARVLNINDYATIDKVRALIPQIITNHPELNDIKKEDEIIKQAYDFYSEMEVEYKAEGQSLDKGTIKKIAHKSDEILNKLITLRKFVSVSQMESLSDLMMGEEKEAGFEIMNRLGDIIQNMPHTYQTDKIDTKDKIVHLHYFLGGSDWYIVEKDKGSKDDKIAGVQRQAFGYSVLNEDYHDAEWGYISILELIQNNVELDFYWTPKKFSEVKKKWEGEEETEPEVKIVSEEITVPGQTEEDLKNIDETYDPVQGKKYLDIYEKNIKDINVKFAIAGVGKDGMNYRFIFVGGTQGSIDFSRDMQPHSYNGSQRENLEKLRLYILNLYMKDQKNTEPELKPVIDLPEALESGAIKSISLAVSTDISSYNNPFEVNKAIEKLLDSKWEKSEKEFSAEELEFIKSYSGYGGLDKFGEISVGSLFEYFTPEKVIEKMWGLAYKYGYTDGPLLEPACGIGSFFDRRFVSNLIEKTGYEINKYSAKIAKLLYPEANINDGKEVKSFEELFIVNNYTVRAKVRPRYRLVIGNPPYGTYAGKFSGMGEKTFTHANNYIDYFLLRGLDVLEKNGLLIYIIGAETAAGGKPFLDQGKNKVKEMISERGKLIDAYRLPSGIFARTDVTSDIVVFRKR